MKPGPDGRPEVDVAELYSLIRDWKNRNESYTGLQIDIELELQVFKQGELFERQASK